MYTSRAVTVYIHSSRANDTTCTIRIHESYLFNMWLFLQCFGASFLQSDLAVFKQNLTALESLNTKHKLYSRVSNTHTHTHCFEIFIFTKPPCILYILSIPWSLMVATMYTWYNYWALLYSNLVWCCIFPQAQFQSSVLYPFLQLLLRVLVQKSHDLLQEEMCLCVYNMASVDFSVYHDQFLPRYVEGSNGLSSEQEQPAGQQSLPSIPSKQSHLSPNYAEWFIINAVISFTTYIHPPTHSLNPYTPTHSIHTATHTHTPGFTIICTKPETVCERRSLLCRAKRSSPSWLYIKLSW